MKRLLCVSPWTMLGESHLSWPSFSRGRLGEFRYSQVVIWLFASVYTANIHTSTTSCLHLAAPPRPVHSVARAPYYRISVTWTLQRIKIFKKCPKVQPRAVFRVYNQTLRSSPWLSAIEEGQEFDFQCGRRV